MSAHTNKIPIYKYYTIDDAINCPVDSCTAFIISNESINRYGKIGRTFNVFTHFKYFLKHREKYPNCHELLVDHSNSGFNRGGRLVFDFDIKKDDLNPDSNSNSNSESDVELDPNSYIPPDFKKQIELTIHDVIKQYMNNVDFDLLDFVWSTSANPKKFSKHLTVKNLYFDDWVELSKAFYQLFCMVWDRSNYWIDSSKLMDFQIIKNKGSLRMVGSSKIGGNPLVFDSDRHQLTDSLIRIYQKNLLEEEQIVTIFNFNIGVFTNIIECKPNTKLFTQKSNTIFSKNSSLLADKSSYDNIIYEKAFEMYDKINPGIFKMGKINGKVISFIRIKAGHCIMSSKHHDNENAFCIINKNENDYTVRTGCYRFCSQSRTIYLGSISADDYSIKISTKLTSKNKYVLD